MTGEVDPLSVLSSMSFVGEVLWLHLSLQKNIILENTYRHETNEKKANKSIKIK